LDRENIFKERVSQYTQQAQALDKQYNLYSTVRVVLFLVAIIAFVYLANVRSGLGVALVAAGFPLVFGIVVNKHNRIARLRNKSKHLKAVNEAELLRLTGNIQSLEDGIEYLQPKHPYAKDMDVFGRNSLYQLINRANTPSGKETVAYWLSGHTSRPEIIERQQAVTELTDQLDWRQGFQASGRLQKQENQSFQSVIDWINAPVMVKHDWLTRLLAYVLPLLIITSILLNIFTDFSVYFTVALAVINGIVLKKYVFYVTDITENTHEGLKTLKAYGDLIEIIENSRFEANLLQTLQEPFKHGKFRASQSILKLQRILEFLHGRANLFYLFFNTILLFDIHLLLKAEGWKQKQQEDVSQWFDKIGKFEALNSLAGLAFANPDFTMPSIDETDYQIKAEHLGHPLIDGKERISNDFEMKGKGSLSLITGSNMSGKSTFLRTVGVNMTLAYVGAPVCAKSMSLSLMQLFTSMRTEDNLEEHISSFYAELQRIKQLLELVKTGQPVLFMLDEILKGTNSHDRHAGAEALIRQMSDKNAMGFVSTHDLALGKLAEEMPALRNYSFNSEIKDDKIIFKYKLEDGLCHSFNASKLMQQIGIDIKPENK